MNLGCRKPKRRNLPVTLREFDGGVCGAMFRAFITNESKIPVSPEPSQKAGPRFGKRSLMLGLAIVAIIAVASIYALFQSPILGVGATGTELKLDYNVGEKMTYQMDVGMQMLDTNISETTTLEMEVQDFDGENYTIKYTISAGAEEDSFTLKMNETGHLVENNELPDNLDEIISFLPSVPGFGPFLTGEEVKVGDSWEIPLDVPEMDLEVKISFVINELGKADVPAGTYDVFKISVESSGFNIEMEGIQVDLEMDGVLSLEKDTCRPVDLDLMLTLETTIEDQTANIDMNLKMTLINHVK
jgi:hypothetical protein